MSRGLDHSGLRFGRVRAEQHMYQDSHSGKNVGACAPRDLAFGTVDHGSLSGHATMSILQYTYFTVYSTQCTVYIHQGHQGCYRHTHTPSQRISRTSTLTRIHKSPPIENFDPPPHTTSMCSVASQFEATSMAIMTTSNKALGKNVRVVKSTFHYLPLSPCSLCHRYPGYRINKYGKCHLLSFM